MIHTKPIPTILLIMGSTRANRLCPTLARWVAEIAQTTTGLTCEPVDLADWLLPMDDEPHLPALGTYTHAHTRAWSAKIASADAIVVVTPQYNWGYPAPLKNAIDHLHDEWRDKPLAIITYGGHGGGKCAAQLAQVAEGLKMRLIPTMPGITLPHDVIRGALVVPDRDLKDQIGTIQQAFAELATVLAKVG